MDKPTIAQTAELMKLRGLLQEISHISMSYSVLNKNYPINLLTTKQADEIIIAYKDLLNRAITLLEAYNYE